MPRKKTDNEIFETVQEDLTETNDMVSDEDTKENAAPECEEKKLIVLKKGGSYHFGDLKFAKNESVLVDSEIAEKLMKTGFLQRSPS